METEASAGGAVKMKVEELRVTKSGMGWGGARVGVGGECAHKRAPNMRFCAKTCAEHKIPCTPCLLGRAQILRIAGFYTGGSDGPPGT